MKEKNSPRTIYVRGLYVCKQRMGLFYAWDFCEDYLFQ